MNEPATTDATRTPAHERPPLTREELGAFLERAEACGQGMEMFNTRFKDMAPREMWDACDNGCFLSWLINEAYLCGGTTDRERNARLEADRIRDDFHNRGLPTEDLCSLPPTRTQIALIAELASALKEANPFERVERCILDALEDSSWGYDSYGCDDDDWEDEDDDDRDEEDDWLEDDDRDEEDDWLEDDDRDL